MFDFLTSAAPSTTSATTTTRRAWAGDAVVPHIAPWVWNTCRPPLGTEKKGTTSPSVENAHVDEFAGPPSLDPMRKLAR